MVLEKEETVDAGIRLETEIRKAQANKESVVAVFVLPITRCGRTDC